MISLSVIAIDCVNPGVQFIYLAQSTVWLLLLNPNKQTDKQGNIRHYQNSLLLTIQVALSSLGFPV